MNKNKNKAVKRSFPDYLAPDEEKDLKSYGLQMAKAIEYEWWKRPNSGTDNSPFYDKRQEYHNLRLYARGEQSSDIYKELISGGDEDTFSNFDWRPIQVAPKFVNLLVNQLGDRLFDVKAEAVDEYSTELKIKKRQSLEDHVNTKGVRKLIKEKMNVDLTPPDNEELPENAEEIDLYMNLKYKPAAEIAAEESIKYTLELNDYDETKKLVTEDLVTLGIGVTRNRLGNNGIEIDYVNPANFIYSYPEHKNFKDVHYYGEVERITINDLKRLANGSLEKEDLEKILEGASDFNKEQYTTEGSTLRSSDLSGMMVNVLHFTFKSTRTISQKKKYLKNGGFKLTKKDSTFQKTNKDYQGYDAVKRVVDVWYKGTLVLGTDYLINYGLCENMVRPKSAFDKVIPPYIVYAPELYQNKTKSLLGRIIPYIDQMQQIHIKLQQMIAKARPNGIFIDIDGIEEVSLGGGKNLDPAELIKMYDETGNIIGTTRDVGGDYNNGRMPIQELKNGVIDGLDRLISSYNHYLNMLRDAIGMPQGVDATTPHPDMAVGLQQQLAVNSNTATRHILDSTLYISKKVSEAIIFALPQLMKSDRFRKSYIKAIGRSNVEIIDTIKNFSIYDIGLNISLKPDVEEKQALEANIQAALSRDTITIDDAQELRGIGNMKLANALLRTKREKREKTKREHEAKLAETQQQSQIQATQIAAQSKMQEIQMQSQAKLQEIQAQFEAKRQEIMAEAEAKAMLMDKEFQYNRELKGMEVTSQLKKEEYKEDRKDKRIDRQNTQASAIAEQKANNTPAQSFEKESFESGFDDIGGGINV